jgi:hypothetical protein
VRAGQLFGSGANAAVDGVGRNGQCPVAQEKLRFRRALRGMLEQDWARAAAEEPQALEPEAAGGRRRAPKAPRRGGGPRSPFHLDARRDAGVLEGREAPPLVLAPPPPSLLFDAADASVDVRLLGECLEGAWSGVLASVAESEWRRLGFGKVAAQVQHGMDYLWSLAEARPAAIRDVHRARAGEEEEVRAVVARPDPGDAGDGEWALTPDRARLVRQSLWTLLHAAVDFEVLCGQTWYSVPRPGGKVEYFNVDGVVKCRRTGAVWIWDYTRHGWLPGTDGALTKRKRDLCVERLRDLRVLGVRVGAPHLRPGEAAGFLVTHLLASSWRNDYVYDRI